MSISIPSEQLSVLSYVDNVPSDGRVVSLRTYFNPNTGDWELHHEVQPGELGRIAGGEPVHGAYYAHEAVDLKRDFEFPLGTLITQHLSFPRALHRLDELTSDLHNCAAVLEKYHIIAARRSRPQLEATVLITSELEYLLVLLRSMYDVLQSIVREIADRLIILDGTNQRVLKNQLPDSFAKVVTRDRELLDAAAIEKTRNLPRHLAEWYATEGYFLKELRDLRDDIVHHGRGLPIVFQLDAGLAIDPSTKPWSRFDLWPLNKRQDSKLGSLRALFAGFIEHSFQASSRFGSVIQQIVKLPDPIGHGVRFFLRNPFGSRMNQLARMREQPWEGIGNSE